MVFGCEVAAPVRDFEVVAQGGGEEDGFGEFVAHGDWVCGEGGHLGVVGSVCER